MTVKEFLQKGRKLNFEIQSLKNARKEAYYLATGITQDYSSEKVQTSKGNSSERKFIAYLEYSEKLDIKITELMEYRSKMLELINNLEDSTYRTLLISRYISCNTWERVAEDIEYSDVWVRTKLHSEALKEAAKYYSE